MKKLILIFITLIVGIAAINHSKDKDPLHKKIFITQVTEIKEGQPPKKSTKDEIEFKDGKLFSNFLNEKFDLKWLKYAIDKDSTYKDADTEIDTRYFEIKASITDADKQTTVIICKINNEYIEGEIKITKNDKPKKRFEFSGSEKATKIKEDKKKKKDE